MKTRIALFGLPPISAGRLMIEAYAGESENQCTNKVYEAINNESGKIIDYLFADIEIGYHITIVILSSGTCEYRHCLKFKGADISHVPNFRKDLNLNEEYVSNDWNIERWSQWNPTQQHDEGLAVERKFLMDRSISVVPVWESYYADSDIDYLEKFHKLWIGLNAYATYRSTEIGDKKKILSLVDSGLKQAFHSALRHQQNERSAEKWRALQQTTGLDMTPNIIRDEIATTCHCFDFLEKAKAAIGLFSDIQEPLNGLVFLNSTSDNEVFQNIYVRYCGYMASGEGIVSSSDLSKAFSSPHAPSSVKRYGRLVFHNPYESSEPGNLFSLEDYFGSAYSEVPYQGQTSSQYRVWEAIDPLFFRYLQILYLFRCAYFHGDLPPNKQNNELARTAYLSLYELFPAIL